jgi:DNA-directed RNA polymerase subunit H (RpoH/RPB5)
MPKQVNFSNDKRKQKFFGRRMSILVPQIAANLLQLLIDRGYVLDQSEIDYLRWYQRRFALEPTVTDNTRRESPTFQLTVGMGDMVIPPPIQRIFESRDGTRKILAILHFPNDMNDPITPYFQSEPHFLKPDQDRIKGLIMMQISREAPRTRVGILLVAPKVLNRANNDIRELASLESKFEMFTLQEMSVDPTRHRLTPAHRVLSPREVAMTKERIKNLNYMPRIKQTDPVAKWLGCDPGQIIRFYRIPVMGILPNPLDRLVENADEQEEGEGEGEGEEGQPVEEDDGEVQEIGGDEGEVYDEDW